jgi:hypothetical protein
VTETIQPPGKMCPPFTTQTDPRCEYLDALCLPPILRGQLADDSDLQRGFCIVCGKYSPNQDLVESRVDAPREGSASKLQFGRSVRTISARPKLSWFTSSATS